jgi:hypothetical protein
MESKLIKATVLPKLVNHERRATITFNVPTAWETWVITIEKDTPELITPDWIENNHLLWNWDDCIDSGTDGGMELIQIDEIENFL